MSTTHTTDQTIHPPICDAVRTALIELLTAGPRTFGAATPATLHAIGATRTALTTTHHANTHNPLTLHAADRDRHLALTRVLGHIAHTLLHPQDPDLAEIHDLNPRQADLVELHSHLTTLAAITLAWLDTLPALPQPPDDPWDDADEGDEAQPF